MKVVMCIEKFETRVLTFKEGEKYLANMVNEKYWIIDSVGVKTEDFTLHFEVIDELKADKTSGSTTETNKGFIEEEREFREFLNGFGGFNYKEDKKEYNKPLIDRIKNYIFV